MDLSASLLGKYITGSDGNNIIMDTIFPDIIIAGKGMIRFIWIAHHMTTTTLSIISGKGWHGMGLIRHYRVFARVRPADTG